ncbi:hypothetical protein HDU96_004134 [Phlyctochytrium bullatum]|nr:hypothetical protein HDU96_004134 [Phlyctochytrium bullatum]
MVSNVVRKDTQQKEDVLDIKYVYGAVGSIFNVMLSMGAVFAAFLYFSKPLADDIGMRLSLALLRDGS